MPDTIMLILNLFLVFFLMPLVLVSLARGSPPPALGTSPLAQYYRVEPYLNLSGNIFLLALGAVAIGKLGLHYGIIEPATAASFDTIASAVFLVLLFVFAGFWVRAYVRVRRQSSSGME